MSSLYHPPKTQWPFPWASFLIASVSFSSKGPKGLTLTRQYFVPWTVQPYISAARCQAEPEECQAASLAKVGVSSNFSTRFGRGAYIPSSGLYGASCVTEHLARRRSAERIGSFAFPSTQQARLLAGDTHADMVAWIATEVGARNEQHYRFTVLHIPVKLNGAQSKRSAQKRQPSHHGEGYTIELAVRL